MVKNITLEIKDSFSSDIDEIWSWEPDLPSDIYFHLEIDIGEFGREGGNIFHLVVTTPEAMSLKHIGNAKKAFLSRKTKDNGKNALIVISDYSWKKLRHILDEIIKSCERESWEDSLEALRKNFFWEYDDLKKA